MTRMSGKHSILSPARLHCGAFVLQWFPSLHRRAPQRHLVSWCMCTSKCNLLHNDALRLLHNVITLFLDDVQYPRARDLCGADHLFELCPNWRIQIQSACKKKAMAVSADA